jgi:ABC-type protease/lipase transport system fused ATPase/permease subunit
MVTHKPSLLQSMNKVLVLRDGRVALFGPKDDVFAKLNEKSVAISTPPVSLPASGRVSS